MPKIATIGAGNIVRKHLNNLDKLDGHNDVEIVAICDVNEEKAQDIASRYDAMVYTDHTKMFDEDTFDALIIGIPPFVHTNQELLAAEHDVHLLVEKPLALSSEQTQKIESAIDTADLVSQVGYMYRYAKITERAVDLISDRTIAVINGHWYSGVPPVDWWRVKERSGGQIVEQATHIYDIVRFFAGDVEAVKAVGSQRVNTKSIDFEDSTTAVMEHENGVVSNVTATSASLSGESEITLIGDEFRLTLDFADDRLYGIVDNEEIDYAGGGETTQVRAMARELDAFLTAVKSEDGASLRSPYSDARKTFELTLAAQESIDTGETISMED